MRFVLAALLALTSPALADDAWQQIDETMPSGLPTSYWVAEASGMLLEIHCAGTAAAPALSMILMGGDRPLPAEIERETEFPVTIVLAPKGDRRSATASWLGAFDNALLGDFPSDRGFLDAFVGASGLRISGPEGGPLFETPMTGANWARFGFGEVCGV